MTQTCSADRLKSRHIKVCSFTFEPNVLVASGEIIPRFSSLVVTPASVASSEKWTRHSNSLTRQTLESEKVDAPLNVPTVQWGVRKSVELSLLKFSLFSWLTIQFHKDVQRFSLLFHASSPVWWASPYAPMVALLDIASPRSQSQVAQRGEEILHLLLQQPVAVLGVLSRSLRVAQLDLQHALLLLLLLHFLF